jgi:methionyl-tRNA synthetase
MIKRKKKTEKIKKFYITTAIDYPNAEPHIGHAYQKVIADVIARWHKMLGEDVYFLTGTDEHGKKIQEKAEQEGKKPREFVDEKVEKFKLAWRALNIDYNRFIRTTDLDHELLVKQVIEKCNENGDIYKGNYEGLYCTGCEAYYTEKECVDGKCPMHNRELEKISEESYFFKLSKYQKFLLNLYRKNKNFIMPEERKSEIINRVKEGLKDLSISRTSFNWGIPFPLDKKHIVYVWFDALFNYISGAGKNEAYWPANIHLLGKDNGWFHCVYWPAFLKSAGYKMPETVFVHGFLTVESQKISKSLGNVISPIYLTDKYGTDSVRYFICRNFVFGQDGDFSEKNLIERHNSELADKFGNLVSRVTALAEKYGVKKVENKLLQKIKIKEIEKLMENYEVDKALSEIFGFIDLCNEYVQSKKPWETHDSKVLYELIDSIKSITILLWPFIPRTCEKIAQQLEFELVYTNIKKNLDYKNIKKSEILFHKIEVKEKREEKAQVLAVNEKINKDGLNVKVMGTVKYDEFAKLDLRVGTVKKVEDVEGADKLLKLEVDCGEGKNRIILAGIKKYYSKEELKGKQIVVIVNLEPRNMKGITSEGMLLAASDDKHEKVVLLTTEKKVDAGFKVS